MSATLAASGAMPMASPACSPTAEHELLSAALALLEINAAFEAAAVAGGLRPDPPAGAAS